MRLLTTRLTRGTMGGWLVICLALAFAGFGTTVAAPFVDHGGPELASDGPVTTPIRHEPFFRGERELFGYNPRYPVGVVSFGPDNEPYITDRYRLFTLNEQGKWIDLALTKAVQARHPDLIGVVYFIDPYLSFDRDGDAYALIQTRRSTGHCYGLLRSTDRCRSWTFHELPAYAYRFEHNEAHNQLPGPPPMVEGRGGEVILFTVAKGPNGRIDKPKRTLVAKVIPPVARKGRHWLTPAHAGCGNVSVTFDGKTHIVWMSIQPLSFHEEEANRLPTEKQGPYIPYARRFASDGLSSLAPCYAATYDHQTGALSAHTIIGFTRRDGHNGPVISVDSRGYLHAVIGAHHDNFIYTRSLEPNSTTGGWTEPVMFGTPKPEPRGAGSYTYTALVCDADDTLHLASRWGGAEDGKWRLVYQRKRRGEPWEPHRDLVVAFRRGYSLFDQKISLDRRGRLWINYLYFIDGMNEEEVEAYRRKWPDDPIKTKDGRVTGQRRHDPCLLVSDDKGDTWRLAVTEDLVP